MEIVIASLPVQRWLKGPVVTGSGSCDHQHHTVSSSPALGSAAKSGLSSGDVRVVGAPALQVSPGRVSSGCPSHGPCLGPRAEAGGRGLAGVYSAHGRQGGGVAVRDQQLLGSLVATN